MDRRKWVGIGVLAVLAAGVIYVKPWRQKAPTLPRLSAVAVIKRAHSALDHRGFSETLEYQDSLLPADMNTARVTTFPVPAATVRSIVLYEASPHLWRMQELDANNAVTGVVARQGRQLITYEPASNERTIESLPSQLSAAGALWQLPSANSLHRYWHVTTGIGQYSGIPAYILTLTPQQPGTLWGAVTYWLDGKNFLPLGVQVTGKGGGVAFMAKLTHLQVSPPGVAALPPTAGRLAASPLSSAAAKTIAETGQSGAATPPISLPAQLGPLPRVSQHQAGGNALAVYGAGPGRVLVLDTAAKSFKGKHESDFLRPMSRFPGFKGVTDGVFSVVTLKEPGREIILFGSRPQVVVAEWARAAWR